MNDLSSGHGEPALNEAVIRGMDHVCDCFEAAWKGGGGPRPRVEAYLSDLMPDPYRSILLGKLLERELACRGWSGEAPLAEEYRARYPGQGALLRALFGAAPPIALSSSGYMPAIAADAETGADDWTLSYVVTRIDGSIGPLLSPEGHAKIRARLPSGRVLLGRYRLEEELGRGGMGQVHRARDRRMDRPVAIKFVIPPKPDPSGDPIQDALHQDQTEEARRGANLRHQAIALVFDHAMDEGLPFTVSESIGGPSLRELLQRWERLPLAEVRRIVGQLAQGLDFAHAQGVVHRDLKPENVRVKDQGQYVLLDFGLARDFRRRADLRAFRGTPAYASPEQSMALPLDGRSDQFSLALLTYELLTGRRPFSGPDIKALFDHLRDGEPPSPRKLVPDLPRTVMAALWRAMHKEPGLRFDSCAGFAAALGCPAPKWADAHQSIRT